MTAQQKRESNPDFIAKLQTNQSINEKWEFVSIENSKILQQIEQDKSFSSADLQKINAELEREMQDSTDE